MASDLTCARCSKPMAKVRASLPQGVAVCQTCRRKATGPFTRRKVMDYGDAQCPVCDVLFTKRQVRQVYCSATCREARSNWTNTKDPKYRSHEHRSYAASLKAELKYKGHLICTAKVCVFGDRTITNPDGRDRDGLQAGHNDAGTAYDGPQHNACNNHDASVRGHAASKGRYQLQTRRWAV